MLDGAFLFEVVQELIVASPKQSLALLKCLVYVLGLLLLNLPLFHHLVVVSSVLKVGLSSFHEVVLKLSYTMVESEVLLIQGGIEMSLVASICHTKFDFQITNLALALQESSELVGQVAQKEDGDQHEERQAPKEVPSFIGVIIQGANFLVNQLQMATEELCSIGRRRPAVPLGTSRL